MKVTDWLKKRLLKTEQQPDPEQEAFRVVVLGTDTRQRPQTKDLSFALLLCCGDGESLVMVDPGPDVERQVWRHLDGDAGAIDAVVLTHTTANHQTGVDALRKAGFEGAVHSEAEGTAGPGSSIMLGGVLLSAFRVQHEVEQETLGFKVASVSGGPAVIIVPHANDLANIEAGEGDFVMLGCGDLAGGDPEYPGLADVVAVKSAAAVVACSDVGELLASAGRLPKNISVLCAGSHVSVHADRIDVHEGQDVAPVVLVPGYVTSGEKGLHVRKGLADGLIDQVQKSLAEAGEVNLLDGDDGERVFDLALVPSASRVVRKAQGEDGEKEGEGGTDICICPECGYEEDHERGTPCNEKKCPECDVALTGKGAPNEKESEKAAVATHETPMSEAEEWDGEAAEATVRTWASSDDSGEPDTIDWEKYRQAFAWYDGDEPEAFGSYKLPHHQVEDGELKVVWPGVSAAGAAVQGARDGADLPEGDVDGVKEHLAAHYAQFEKTPPWDEENEDE